MTPGTSDAIDRARQVDILNLAERQFGAKLEKVTPTEWVGPCPKCGGTDRFSINTSKQIFNCRGCSAGGDAIALVGLVLGIPFEDALERINGEPIKPTRTTPEAEDETFVSPVPADAPSAPAEHPRLGKPSGWWTYLTDKGGLESHVMRFDLPYGRKEFRPLTLWRGPEGLRWRWWGVPSPRRLYGHDRLAARPGASVLICEGEKAADAAQEIFPDCIAITSPNGAGSENQADWEPLKGRDDVLIWPDNDKIGADYGCRVAAILRGLGCKNIRIIDVARLVEIDRQKQGQNHKIQGWDAADAREEWANLAELREEAIGLAEPFKCADGDEQLDEAKPRLKIDKGHPDNTVSNLRDILAKSGKLYERGTPVRIVYDQSSKGSVAHTMTADSLALEAHFACQPFEIDRKTESERDALLPSMIARMYLGWRGEWRLPPLNGITTAPLLSDDGSIRTASGYDAATGLWCENVPDVASFVPDRPSRDEAAAALLAVRDVFKTFCFADAKTIMIGGVNAVDICSPPGMDESSFLCSLLGSVCRASLWLGPGSLFRAAPHSGSGAGKGLLARCICAVAYGRQPSAVTAGGSAEELEKRISAALLEGGPAILLDNFNNITLRSASLESALTERPAKVRQFRTLELVTVNTVASVFITGNGVLLAQDSVRRVIPTEFDARTENPERRQFASDILADVARSRAGILAAMLTIWRFGRLARGIERGITLGSYERWCEWVRDPLLSLGCLDPVARLTETKTRDPMRQATGDLFAVWWKHHGPSPQTGHGLDFEVLKLIDPHARGRQFVAAYLEKLSGTRLAGFVLTRQAPVSKWSASTYALSKTRAGEAINVDCGKDEPSYPPYDAYDFPVGTNESAPPGAEDPPPAAQCR
jgi:hypothetical protein